MIKSKLKGFLEKLKTSGAFRRDFFIIVTVLAFLILFGYWVYGYYFVSTNDAYVNANVVQIAPRVTGQVLHLYFDNNRYVKRGDLLFELDPMTFAVAVKQAEAALAQDEAKWRDAQLTATRTVILVKKGVASAQNGDTAMANLQSAAAQVQQDKANIVSTELNLYYTKVFAPTNGWICNMTLREGNVVEANQPLFALISSELFWVDSNFEETDLARMHPGQPAKITVDMYPGHVFNGVVDSLSGGSGVAFSLLPPQNATGNWVKVTQRVPVKVIVTDPDLKNYPLRIGTSATVTVNTLKKKL